jgi:sugar phosphate isomerase/epimerase
MIDSQTSQKTQPSPLFFPIYLHPMHRRPFIRNISLAGLAALTRLPVPAPPTSYPLGYQLFSVREDMNADPIATLKALRKMGYRHFEVYGFDAEKTAYYGLAAREFRRVLDELDLRITSGHYTFHPLLDASEDALNRYVDQCIAGASVLDSPYITWPWMAPEQRTRATFERLPDLLNRIGERVTAAGLGFAYHNHGFEFADYGGQTGMDRILRNTDPDLVKLQIDMYWVMHAATTTPKQLIAEQPGRYVMWHIKDLHPVSRDYTELGRGTIHYRNVLPDPATSGLEYLYIEQGGNYTHTAMRSAATSAVYYQQKLREVVEG